MKSKKKPRLTAEQRRSIDHASWLCKQVLGKEYRHVHERMEGARPRRGRKP